MVGWCRVMGRVGVIIINLRQRRFLKFSPFYLSARWRVGSHRVCSFLSPGISLNVSGVKVAQSIWQNVNFQGLETTLFSV